VARADLVVVGGGLGSRLGGGVATIAISEVLRSGKGGEIGRGEFGGNFPL